MCPNSDLPRDSQTQVSQARTLAAAGPRDRARPSSPGRTDHSPQMNVARQACGAELSRRQSRIQNCLHVLRTTD
uniref:Uncharacterized protein n=1 Tax=Knipowitschia caucasica TaxID=637954 RepID=A0AAV2J9P7_KNICA